MLFLRILMLVLRILMLVLRILVLVLILPSQLRKNILYEIKMIDREKRRISYKRDQNPIKDTIIHYSSNQFCSSIQTPFFFIASCTNLFTKTTSILTNSSQFLEPNPQTSESKSPHLLQIQNPHTKLKISQSINTQQSNSSIPHTQITQLRNQSIKTPF